MSFIALIAIAVCLLVIVWRYLTHYHISQIPRLLRGLQHSRLVLRSSTLASRAAPNQRLVEIFNIDNAFTTTDPVYHARFVREIRGMLQTRDEKWKILATTAFNNFRESLLLEQETHGDGKFVKLVPLVQYLVFRVILLKFFPQIPEPSKDDVKFITARINSLWLATKYHSSQTDANLPETKMRLERGLREIFEKSPTDQMDGRANPLNIIIPAYESIWRVVLRCFLEVRFRAQGKETDDGVENFDCQPIFARFMHMPNPSVFETPFMDTHISIKHIVNEALRLYPPTRRIHRQIENERVKIDVEWLHRDPVSWGLDAEEFRPERWEGVRLKGGHAKLAFLPFGVGALSCPAVKFAPMMMGVLVGVLMEGVDDGWELVDSWIGGDVLGTRVLDGGREAYAGLCLRKIEN